MRRYEINYLYVELVWIHVDCVNIHVLENTNIFQITANLLGVLFFQLGLYVPQTSFTGKPIDKFLVLQFLKFRSIESDSKVNRKYAHLPVLMQMIISNQRGGLCAILAIVELE